MRTSYLQLLCVGVFASALLPRIYADQACGTDCTAIAITDGAQATGTANTKADAKRDAQAGLVGACSASCDGGTRCAQDYTYHDGAGTYYVYELVPVPEEPGGLLWRCTVIAHNAWYDSECAECE